MIILHSLSRYMNFKNQPHHLHCQLGKFFTNGIAFVFGADFFING